jgi:uncharacterized protein YaaN involved in tellurite resistance
MPKTKQAPQVRTRLRSDDLERLNRICEEENKPTADIVRQAILYFMDHREADKLDQRETKLERRMKAMEDRLAGLHMKTAKELAMMQMRTSIDVGLIYEAVFYNFGAEAEKAFKAFHKHTINRLKWKRDDDEDKKTIGKLISDLYKRDDG